MKKQIEKILENSPLKIRWNNMGSWVTEKRRNLLAFCRDFNVKIKPSKQYDGTYFVITMVFNETTFKTITTFINIEREVGRFAAYRAVYLGDDTTVDTKFRNYKLRR